VQRKFVRYTLRGIILTDMYDLSAYVDRCTLICIETLAGRCSNTYMMFVFEGWLTKLIVSCQRDCDFLRIDYYRTKYGVHEPLNDAVFKFSNV
jgi:hypothetical protein